MLKTREVAIIGYSPRDGDQVMRVRMSQDFIIMKLRSYSPCVSHAPCYIVWRRRPRKLAEFFITVCLLYNGNRVFTMMEVRSHTTNSIHILVKLYCAVSSDVVWALWRLKSPATRRVIQQLAQANKTGKVKGPYYWPFVRKIHWWLTKRQKYM